MKTAKKTIASILSAVALSAAFTSTAFATTVVKPVVHRYAVQAEDAVRGPALVSGTFIATVTAEGLEIYKNMGSGETIGRAQKGDVFQILGDMGNGYVKVSYFDQEGFLAVGEGKADVREVETVEDAVAASTESQSRDRRQSIVNFALQFVGGRYVYGGTNPHVGADCSGFVKYVLEKAGGVGMLRTSSSQATQGTPVGSVDQLKPGDLIFYGTGSRYINHVAMYIGNGRVVHASSSKTGIIVTPYNYRTPVKMVNVIGS